MTVVLLVPARVALDEAADRDTALDVLEFVGVRDAGVVELGGQAPAEVGAERSIAHLEAVDERPRILGAARLIDGVRHRFDDEAHTERARVGGAPCRCEMLVADEQRRRQ